MRFAERIKILALAAVLVQAMPPGCKKKAGPENKPQEKLREESGGRQEGARDGSRELRLKPMPPSDGEDVVVCPFCGLKLRRNEAAASFEYEGEIYYFCTKDHMEAFKKNPEMYLDIDNDDSLEIE